MTQANSSAKTWQVVFAIFLTDPATPHQPTPYQDPT
jgi:hypothetical protein